MKTEKNILIAFILNLGFAIFEIIGGLLTNSISIISDAIHDFGDSLSIGLSYFLEKKSHKKPDNIYTYGYSRFSILGAFITSSILICGSIFVIINAISRFINPVELKYNGMIILALIGLIVNCLAAYFTKDGKSLNQKAVNIHMLEDVLGWLIVLIGSILMKFTEITYIDSIMSLCVALFILINAFKNFKNILDLFLEKIPNNISITDIRNQISNIEDIKDIHHIHVWSIDGENNYATMHVVTDSEKPLFIKKTIRERLNDYGIIHVTIEIEKSDEECRDIDCELTPINHRGHHHH